MRRWRRRLFLVVESMMRNGIVLRTLTNMATAMTAAERFWRCWRDGGGGGSFVHLTTTAAAVAAAAAFVASALYLHAAFL